MWQAGPAGCTRMSSVSPSQSGVIDSTAIVLPDDSPFFQSRLRDREWKCARPVSRVASSASWSAQATISTSPLPASWTTQATSCPGSRVRS